MEYVHNDFKKNLNYCNVILSLVWGNNLIEQTINDYQNNFELNGFHLKRRMK